MNLLLSKCKNRREFIKSCFRLGIGAGLLLTGVALGIRKKSDSNENDLCQLSTPCQGCLIYSGCSLPRALTVKNRVEKEGGNGGRN